MPASAEKTPRLQQKERLLGKLNFALLLCSLWLGMTAASATLLMALNPADNPAPANAKQVTTSPAIRTIAESPYRTWDDVATAPLPGGRAKGLGRTPSAGGRGTARHPAGLESDRPSAGEKRDARTQHGKQDRIKRDPASLPGSIVDL